VCGSNSPVRVLSLSNAQDVQGSVREFDERIFVTVAGDTNVALPDGSFPPLSAIHSVGPCGEEPRIADDLFLMRTARAPMGCNPATGDVYLFETDGPAEPELIFEHVGCDVRESDDGIFAISFPDLFFRPWDGGAAQSWAFDLTGEAHNFGAEVVDLYDPDTGRTRASWALSGESIVGITGYGSSSLERIDWKSLSSDVLTDESVVAAVVHPSTDHYAYWNDEEELRLRLGGGIELDLGPRSSDPVSSAFLPMGVFVNETYDGSERELVVDTESGEVLLDDEGVSFMDWISERRQLLLREQTDTSGVFRLFSKDLEDGTVSILHEGMWGGYERDGESAWLILDPDEYRRGELVRIELELDAVEHLADQVHAGFTRSRFGLVAAIVGGSEDVGPLEVIDPVSGEKKSLDEHVDVELRRLNVISSQEGDLFYEVRGGDARGLYRTRLAEQ
jgi:hypothetical protein